MGHTAEGAQELSVLLVIGMDTLVVVERMDKRKWDQCAVLRVPDVLSTVKSHHGGQRLGKNKPWVQ